MRDDEQRVPLAEAGQQLFDGRCGFGVQGRAGLIEQQDLGLQR
jgi:hypothetical protein